MDKLQMRLRLMDGKGKQPAYDAFAASIVHAYEPARRVLSSYTGALVRLRRASDNAEADFGYDGDGNLDVAAIAAWAGGASYVVTVYDQAPAGDDVTMAVAGSQPLYVASIKNGHAGPQFDGTDDSLGGAFTIGGALSQPCSIFTAAQLDASVVNNDIAIVLSTADDVVNRLQLYKAAAASPDNWSFYAGAAIDAGDADANWNIWAGLFSGASSQLWINGASKASGNAGAQNPNGCVIGSFPTGINAHWKGPIVSHIIFDPALSDTDRLAMQTAINRYWSIY